MGGDRDALGCRVRRHWGKRYVNEELSALECRLLAPPTRRLGNVDITGDELKEIVRWKSRRTLGVLERDPDIAVADDTIREVTRVALARETTPEWMRHRILCFHYGVGHPVASAILTIWDPDNHTVIDVRTVGALRKLWELELLDVEPPSRTDRYRAYLLVFRRIAKSLGAGYRDLDRALWKWNKERMPRHGQTSLSAAAMRANGPLMARGPVRAAIRQKPRFRKTAPTWAFIMRADDGNRTRTVSLGIYRLCSNNAVDQ